MAFWTAQLVECVEENVDKRNRVGAVAVLPSIHLHQCQGGPPPLDLSSRLPRRAVGPEESWAFGPPKEMKIADNLRLCPSHVTAAKVSATLPFVIPPAPACRGSELRISYYAALINGHVCGFQ
jgi:hypothetical protein